MKPVITLVLLANDFRAKLLENRGPGSGLSEIAAFDIEEMTGAPERSRDRSGRNTAAPGMALHANADLAEAEGDQARVAFVRALLDKVAARFRARKADRFVMSAAPATLGVLRAELPAPLREALVLDTDKDFTAQAPRDVVKRLEDAIVF